MSRLLIAGLMFCILAGTASAQGVKGRIASLVKDADGKPIENLAVELLAAKDSTLVKVSLTEPSGRVEFINIPVGNYLLRVRDVRWNREYSETVNLSAASLNAELPALVLTPKSGSLKEVTVTSNRPFIQKLSDRLVVNVDGSILSAGSSAMEVLERSPGVLIDQNDQISLRGRSGIIIMIDGKPSPMSGAELANYLRGLPSGSIDRIELITNPSAKYDAAGNSGIIDIRMKKDQRLGLNGTLTTGYGQGVYPKANAGTNFNYRNKIINLFGNYNYIYRMNLNHLILDRSFIDNNKFDGKDQKDNYTKIPIDGHNARFGIDWFPSAKTTIGFVVNANHTSVRPHNDNNSLVIDEQQQPEYRFKTDAKTNSIQKNIVGNINLKQQLNGQGHELTADVDYGVFRSSQESLTNTTYYTLSGQPLQPSYILQGSQLGNLSLATAKTDYALPMKKKWKLEAGFKTSFVSADNDARFFDLSGGTPINDAQKTNHFWYDENNNAAYVNVSKQYNKLDIQVGLRAEQTNIKTRQEMKDVRWDSSYFQLFPSAFFNYKVKEGQTIGLSVSRRIDRPGYNQLNPFLFLIDVTTYATGNPALLPQLTWNYELSYTLKNYNFALNYSRTENNQNIAIARYNDVFPNNPAGDNVTVQIPVNLFSSEYYGLSISAPFKIKKWWMMTNNLNAYYNHFNGVLGNTVLKNGTPAADIRSNNSFTFNKGWSAELNGSYSTERRNGFMVSRPQWSLSAGVQKNVMQGRGTIRFNVSDIFWTNLPNAVITYNNYVEKWKAYRETRVANLVFTYRFGNNTVQAARKRTTGSEEERQRAGG